MPLRFDSFLQGGAGGGVAGDPYWDSVALLVANGDGSDGNTDMVDKGPASRALTWVDNAQIDTGIEKFSGKATLLLDGAGDYIHTPDHVDFSLGTEDFTLEAWVYPSTIVSQDTIISQYKASTNRRAWHFHLSAGKPNMWFSPGGTGSGAWALATDDAVSTDTWSWVVWQREGSDFRIWVGGSQNGTPLTKSTGIHDSNDTVKIGRKDGTDQFHGNLGPLRLTVGIARYPGAPATISVPTGPYPEF